MDKSVDENLIEETIRRVAAQKAALAAAAPEEGGAPPSQDAAEAPPAPKPRDAAKAEPSPADDLIEATIRRVAAEKAAREQATPPDAEPPVASAPVDEAAPESPTEPVVETPSASEPAPAGPPPAPAKSLVAFALEPEEWRTPAYEAPAAAPSLDALASIERSLSATAASLTAAVQRLEALLPLFERQSPGPRAAASAPSPAAEDDAWDDAPQISRLPLSPPRPTILRDPSPLTATAEHLVDADVIDTRPLPKPLPPLHVEPKRGLDLLPRTYRITVEDKRRGVDLVPLHRALLSMDGVKDMSLLSYNNGVAIVSLETSGEIEPDTLGEFVSRAMSRDAKVEQHNEHTMVVKLAEE